MKKFKRLFFTVGSFLLTCGTSFGFMMRTIGNDYKNNAQSAPTLPVIVDEEIPLTKQQKLLNSLMEMDGFNVEGVAEFKLEDSTKFNVDISVAGDISDFSNIAVKGDLTLDLNGLEIPASIGYFDSNLYFSYRDNKFQMKTDSILNFVSMLPDLGVNISLPEQLTNIDLNTITSLIDGMEERVSPNGDINFVLDLEGISLFIKTDANYTFKGIRTDHISFNGTDIYINLDLDPVSIESLNLVSPKEDGTSSDYQKFEPMFNMFNAMSKTFGKSTNTIQLNVSLDKEDEEQFDDFLDASLDFSYDFDNMLFTIDGNVDENNRHHNFKAGLVDSDLLFNYNDIKLAIETSTISDLIAFIVNKVGESYLDDILNSVTSLMSDIDIEETISKLDSLLGKLIVDDGLFAVELDTEAFDLGCGVLTPTIKFDNDGLHAIELKGIGVGNMIIDVELKVIDYSPIDFVKEEFVQFDPALTLVDAILPLIEQTNFRIEIDAAIEDVKGEKAPVTIDGGLQFDIDTLFGYGEIDIIDRTGYDHNIKADMNSPENIIFAYNDTMKGKFQSRTMVELFEVIMDVVTNPDDHFIELFGDLIDMFKDTPLLKVINGDFDVLLETNLVNSINVDNDSMEIDLPLEIIGMDKNANVEILYSSEGEVSTLKGLSLSLTDFEGMNVSFDISLTDFDTSLESQRLDPYDEYLDFSDIKVLLQLGINTSKFDYFHFTATLKLNISIIPLTDIPLDIKIRNDHGHVQVQADFLDIPTLLLFSDRGGYTILNSRSGTLYYEGENIYIKRVDNVKTKIFGGDKLTVTYSKAMTIDYFVENILDVILGDLLGFNDDLLVQLVGKDGSKISSSSKQIAYEKILKSFAYDEAKSLFKFVIDLNSLANVSILDTGDLTVYTNENELTGLKVALTVHVLINITVDLSINLVDKNVLLDSNILTEMNTWLETIKDLPINKMSVVSIVDR